MSERARATIETILYDDQFINENPELELTLEAEALQITVEQMQTQSAELTRSGDTVRQERLARAMARLSELLSHVREEMSQIGIDLFDTLEAYSIISSSTSELEESSLTQYYTPEGIEFLREVFGDISDLDLDEHDFDGIITAIARVKGLQRAMSEKSRAKLETLLLQSEEVESVTVKEQAFSYAHGMLSGKLLEQSTIQERKDILATSIEEHRLLPPSETPSVRSTVAQSSRSSETDSSWASIEVRKYLEKKYPRVDDNDEALAWQKDAVCQQVDPEVFFPEKGGSTRDAKSICSGCEVKAECLNYALQNDERFGIWGGLSERERRRLRRRQFGGA